MESKIVGTTVPIVEMKLNAGETVYTQSGGMAYQTDGIEMTTNARGGVMRSLGRMFSGESIFMAHYTAKVNDATVAFATTVPGSIMRVDLNGTNELIVQKGAFLCAQSSIDTKVTFTKKFSAGLFGGEGFILQRVSGTGALFLEVDGDPIVKTLGDGEVLKVDSGNVVAFEPSISYEIETIKGLGNIFLGGEGLFLTKLTGPGRVIIQSQNFQDFANKLIPFMPSSNN